MRSVVVVFLVLAATTAVARPSPPPPPPQCLGPDTWESIARCLHDDEPSLSQTVAYTEHVRGATDATHHWGRIYVQELDGKWRNVRAFTPAAQIASDTTTGSIRRIEIRELVDYGYRTMLRMKYAVVCGAAPDRSCQLRPYECSAMVNGRTVEVVRGELRVDPKTNTLALDVDRSHGGDHCNIF